MLITRQELESMQGVISTPVEAENMLSDLLDKLQRRFEGLVNAEYGLAAGDRDKTSIHVSARVHEMMTAYKNEVIQHICMAHDHQHPYNQS